jgi:hypothetical protein
MSDEESFDLSNGVFSEDEEESRGHAVEMPRGQTVEVPVVQ